MKIISHRGFWNNKLEKNQEIAFMRSWLNDFGLETDVRDFNEKLVISHDIANSKSIDLELFLDWYVQFGNETTLALNVKADGLALSLKNCLNKFNVKNYFVFDMSIPDSKEYISNNLVFYSRQSEIESDPVFYDFAKGIWLDSFDLQWYTADLIKGHLNSSKDVAIVSPELHGRDYLPFWHWLKKNKLQKEGNILLCTDFPMEAKKFFYE